MDLLKEGQPASCRGGECGKVRGRLISQLDSLLMLLPAAAELVLLTPVDTTAKPWTDRWPASSRQHEGFRPALEWVVAFGGGG
jgi:hypothetical protein